MNITLINCGRKEVHVYDSGKFVDQETICMTTYWIRDWNYVKVEDDLDRVGYYEIEHIDFKNEKMYIKVKRLDDCQVEELIIGG